MQDPLRRPRLRVPPHARGSKVHAGEAPVSRRGYKKCENVVRKDSIFATEVQKLNVSNVF